MSIDIFSIFAEDKRMVLYRPEWRKLTGSVTATILLQQIIYHWNQNGRKPFYKFKEPCGHDLYKPGDSWCEELGFSRKEFDSAIKRIGRKRGKKQSDAHDALVEYWTDMSRLTYYTICEERLKRLLADLYAAEEPQSVEAPENDAPTGETTQREDGTLANAQKGLYVKSERDVTKSPKGTLDLKSERGVTKSPKGTLVNKEDQRSLTEKEITTERESSPALALFFKHFPTVALPDIARQEIVDTVQNIKAWKYTISYWRIKGYQAQYSGNMLDYYQNKALPNFAADPIPATRSGIPETPPLDDLPAVEAALKQRLQARINAPSFNTWLRPLTLLSLDEAELVFHAPDETFVYWLDEYYSQVLKETSEELLGFEPAIRVAVNGKSSPPLLGGVGGSQG